MIPARQWISDLMMQKRMPVHIVRHSCMVRMAAMMIAGALKDAGCDIDLKLVDSAALLHDICKMDSLKGGGDHAAMGRELMESHGYHRIGAVIGQHIRLDAMEPDESMIVNYADKRVMHDKVVSLERRFLDLMDRYGTSEQSMQRILNHYVHASEIEQVLLKVSGMDLSLLGNLNLIPGDYSFYAGNGLTRQDGTVEEQDHHVNLKRIHEDEPV